MTRAVDFCFFLLKVAIAALLLTMVLLVFGNVVLRYAFNTGITFSEELSRMCFVWLTFLGAVVAMREHGHLGMDSLLRRLPPAGAKAAALVGQLLVLWATWLMISGSWTQTLINWHVSAPATGISMGLFYGAGLAFGIPAALIVLWDIYAILTGRLDVQGAGLVQESEEEAVLADPLAPKLSDPAMKSNPMMKR